MGKQRERKEVDGGGGSGGGISISGILQAADQDAAPPRPSDCNTKFPKQKQRRRQKKKAPKEEGASRTSHEEKIPQMLVLSKGKGSANYGAKAPEVSVLKPGKNAKTNANARNARNNVNNDTPEVAQLKQKLFEATRDLEKEKNTREMLENRVKSLSVELKKVKDTLGEDRHFCIGTLKQELEYEQQLRLDVQNDVQGLEKELASQQKKIYELEKEIESERRAQQPMAQKLQASMKAIESEKALQLPLQNRIVLEQQKNQDLQKRLQNESALNIAIRMELQSTKGMRDRVNELEEQLRLERAGAGQRKSSDAEYTATKMELQSAKRQLRSMQRKDSDADKVATEKEHGTQSPSRMKHKDVDEDEKDRLVRKLRRELQETRMKLKNERRKSAASVSKPPQKLLRPKRSLSDFVVAPTNSRQHAGLIPIVQTHPSTNMTMPARAIEASLPSSPTTQTPAPAPAPAEPPSLFHYDDDDASVIADKDMESLHDELTFLRSAYDPDEILIEENSVTHFMELSSGSDSGSVSVAITVSIPSQYPASGVLGVKAILRPSKCSHAVRKCAKDALSELEEIGTWEAQANEGREGSIHEVFSVASGWANLDWLNILSKELSLSISAEEESTDVICACLIHTHHLIEAEKEKVQTVKKNASKLSLGGYVKCGKPGLILVEGVEEDCDNLLEALLQSTKVFQSSAFKRVGKVLRKVSDVESCRCLPKKMEELGRKDSMDLLQDSCEKLGLGEELNDVVVSSH